LRRRFGDRAPQSAVRSQYIIDDIERMNVAIYREVSLKDGIDEFGFANPRL
jgi:hypothetical protein